MTQLLRFHVVCMSYRQAVQGLADVLDVIALNIPHHHDLCLSLLVNEYISATWLGRTATKHWRENCLDSTERQMVLGNQDILLQQLQTRQLLTVYRRFINMYAAYQVMQ